MPRLPDPYGVRPTPQPGRAIASYDGSAVPNAIQGLVQTLDKKAEEYQREQDAEAIFAARRKLDEWEREKIFGENGATSKLGRDSFGIGETLTKDFDNFSGQVTAGLSSRRQRQVFQEVAQGRRAQIIDWSNRHERTQRDSYAVGQYKADVSSMQDRAALFPNLAANEVTQLKNRTIEFMRSRGRSEEEIQAEVKSNSSAAHLNVISSLLSSDVEAAKLYFDKNKADMTDNAMRTADNALRETVARSRAQTATDDYMARGLSMSDALAEARQKFSGNDEQAVTQEIKTRFAERQAAIAQDQKQASDEAWKIITNGGSRKSIKPELWNRLGGEEQRHINDYNEAKWRRAKADALNDKIDDTEAYYRLRQLSANEPDEFSKLDLLKYDPFLSKSSMARLVEIQAGINKNDAKTQSLNKLVSNTVKSIRSNILAAGIDLSPKEGSKQAKEYEMFINSLTTALDSESQAGRLDEKRAREIGMSMLREGIEQGSGFLGMFQTKKRGYEIAAENDGKTYVSKRYDDIPAEIRDRLVNEYRSSRQGAGPRGQLSDDQKAAIERAYQRGIEQGRF